MQICCGRLEGKRLDNGRRSYHGPPGSALLCLKSILKDMTDSEKPPAAPAANTAALRAYAVPFAVFMALLALVSLVQKTGKEGLFFTEPKYWIFPLQTLICGVLVVWYWRWYRMERPRQWFFTIGIAVLVLVLWISPQMFFGAAPRLEGFNPEVFPPDSPLYWSSLALRFLRLVIVVPLVEEIFWRGFLLRYLIREDFEKVPFGSANLFSFSAVTLCFGLAHWGPDFVPALVTGALYNWLAIRTKSLSACVIAHAITNLLLGVYIMATRQWGFW